MIVEPFLVFLYGRFWLDLLWVLLLNAIMKPFFRVLFIFHQLFVMIIFTYLLGIPFRGCLLAVSSLSDGCCVYVGYGRDVSLVWMFAASLLDHAAILRVSTMPTIHV